MSLKKQLAEMYGFPIPKDSSFILLRGWQKKRKEALKRRRKRKNKEKE